ncbi:MAG: serine/threonine protein kinase [Deltaproteobacteria bacterium]|nr:serine/threonine protein kinase [Deltaproteobacteria bacterium]MBT8480946.1 serine/threonine protein kinase [Deltaproteobacteria bacterium]NNK08334.1 serine/threonine protein kinase [Myxococcales bacterium]NNL23813.1 serine/threonine protein kinase [Myxococcales bacterium]
MNNPTSIGLGTILAGRYELVGELARGAMGDVFEALDRLSGSKAAVKLLRAEYLSDESMRRRFRREGAVLKALDHPALVRLFELGIDDAGLVFLVTEYVEGQTLAERLSAGPVTIVDADALVDALSGGLGAAHEHGVFHGDLKPGNVIWPDEGRPRLVDFGASKILGLDRLTATGEVSGTPAYMAPEVLTGKTDVDQRIDVYGLGVLLYEALSGKKPFEDRHLGRLMMKIDAGDCLPIDAVADLPGEIARVIERAMHRKKAERFTEMAELRAAWHRARAK